MHNNENNIPLCNDERHSFLKAFSLLLSVFVVHILSWLLLKPQLKENLYKVAKKCTFWKQGSLNHIVNPFDILVESTQLWVDLVILHYIRQDLNLQTVQWMRPFRWDLNNQDNQALSICSYKNDSTTLWIQEIEGTVYQSPHHLIW